MFKSNGFSLFELLVTIAILAIALAFAMPGFNHLIEEQRLRNATRELRNALDQTRETAVLKGQSISIVTHAGDWAQGWDLFIDSNHNGIRESPERLLSTHEALAHIRVLPDATSRNFVLYTPRGQSIQASGAFHSGHFVLCTSGNLAARIVINRAGRIRQESSADSSLCLR